MKTKPAFHILPLRGSGKLPPDDTAPRTRGTHFKPLALALALGGGLFADSAQAQAILEVGGAGVIADETLTTANVPAVGVNWTAAGGNGNTFSSLISPVATVANTGTVTLTFTHRYNFETTFDGGVVFVSVNGGAFTKVPLASFTSNGYNDTAVASVWAAGDAMFGAQSTDYGVPTLVTSVADLGPLNAADTVAVEFRGGWDGNTFPGPPNWEIGTVQISDLGGAILDVNFTTNGKSGFTASTTGTGTSPFKYLQPVSRFEIDATAVTSDRYAPVSVGSVINLNGANIEVVKLTGTLVAAQVYTLFDLSGGTTLAGTLGSISLPAGTWDTTTLATNGTITLVAPPPVGIYEPFDYPAGVLAGKSGSSEYGFSGAWGTNPNVTTNVISKSVFGAVARKGGSIETTGGVNHYGGQRPVSTIALAENGLLANGATLWFSVDVGYGTGGNLTNSRLGFALANSQFSTSNFLYNINSEGPQLGRGLGLTLGRFNLPTATNGVVAATLFNNTGTGFAGNTFGTLPPSAFFTAGGQHGLIVGKITWGDPSLLVPTLDTIELFRPATDLVQPATPFSTLTVDVDQSTFDTVTFCWGDKVVLDEIRFGASYAAVTPPDVSGPNIASTKVTGPLLQATFDEPVAIGTGNIRIIDPTGPTTLTTIAVTDSSQVSLSADGLTLSILTTVLPVPGTTYYVEFDAGTVVDTFTNAFAGNTGPAAWSFTTESTAPVATITSPPAVTPIYGTPTIPYTVSFNKFYMNDATVTAADFVNTGTASISVGTVTRVSAASALAVYSFDVTTSSPGTVQLRIAGPISDTLGNAFVAPFDDTDIYTLGGSGPAKKTITLDSTLDISLRYVAGSTKTFTFNASASDKLVVIGTGEHNFGANLSGKIKTVTYDGVSLIKAVERLPPLTTLQTTSSLWYLDNPSSVHTAGQIVMTVEGNGTNYVQTAFALSGTAPGFGAATAATIGSSATQLIPSSSSSFVVSWVTFGGAGNTATTAESVLANSPVGAVTFGSKRQPNNYAGHALARTSGLAPNAYTFSFNTALTDVLGLSVEFLAADAPPGYPSWASVNGASLNLELDHDGDGVQNGIEYLLGGPSGNTTGFTALPGVVDTAGTLSVTWPKGAGYAGVYGTDYLVETSDSLGTWVTETIAGGNIVDTANPGGSVKYTFPGPLSGKNFARLKVTGP